jgi:hypothetical protein
MTRIAFRKTLSANDVGTTGGHQAGVLIPKGEKDLLDFLPYLDPSVKNPDAWLSCANPDGHLHRFRFVYYNNKRHDAKGTRNEYRITYMTKWFRDMGAREGDIFEIAREAGSLEYIVSVIKDGNQGGAQDNAEMELPTRIQLRGWHRVH